MSRTISEFTDFLKQFSSTAFVVYHQTEGVSYPELSVCDINDKRQGKKATQLVADSTGLRIVVSDGREFQYLSAPTVADVLEFLAGSDVSSTIEISMLHQTTTQQ